MSESVPDKLPRLFLYAPSREYVRPYFERMMPEYELTDSITDADAAVMLSTVDVYDIDEGLNINELAPLRSDCPELDCELQFLNDCREHGLRYVLLRCAPVVCTGMQGYVRRLAERIYRGTYIGLSGNEAVRSVVHAVDLPLVARLTIGNNDIYNVTDGRETPVNELADALAWRMSQKRVMMLKPKWYKLLFGKRKMAEASRSLCFSDGKLRSVADYQPTVVVDYLKNHVYDQHSL